METIRSVNFVDALVSMSGILFIIGLGVVFLNQHFQKNLAAQKLKQEALKSKHLIELHRSSLYVQEEERQRIAQDLHDELGSIISIMRMNLVMLEQQAGDGTGEPTEVPGRQLQDGLHNVRTLTETALASLRTISHQLMPPQLASFGLIPTLRSVIGQINQTGELEIDLNETCDVGELPRMFSITLYRIVMELVNNTIRHGGATRVSIDIRQDGRYISCDYCDNGRGLGETDRGEGLGHRSIEGRVSALEGDIQLGNGESGGFRAIVRLPLDIG
jgi:signal transduction histidine kinase